SSLRRAHALAAGVAIFLTQFAGNCNGGGGMPMPMCMVGGTPVLHTADITADETWESGVHVVPATIHVKSGARLTIALCIEVQLAVDASIVVDATASGIDSCGDIDSPVRFVRSDPAAAWGSLQVSLPATAGLAFTTFVGGGGSRDDFEGAT